MGHRHSISKREIHSNTGLLQETRKISNKQSDLTPKGTRKGKQIKPKVSRGKEIIKMRVKVNKIVSKKYTRFMKTRAGF